MLLQFQRIDPISREHLGGLYIDRKHIVAVFSERASCGRQFCNIAVSGCVVYCVANSMLEVLEAIANCDGLER